MIHCLPARVRTLLQEQETDPAIADYLVGVSEEVEAGTLDFDDFLDTVLIILRDSVIASNGKQALTEQLLAAQDTVSFTQSPESIQAVRNEAETMLAPETLSDLMRRSHISHGKSTADVVDPVAEAAYSGASEDVALLRDATGVHTSIEYLEHILRQHGNLEAAASWVLDQPDLANLESKWRLHMRGSEELQKQRQQSKQDQDAINKSIVASFAFAPEAVSRSKPGKLDKATPWGETKKPASTVTAGMVRYRDGIKVASKGEKHIYEQVQPDWDGGSRGRVYTKGKRGKGFH